MRINHGDALELESIVRGVFGCDRGGMGGYIDADHFESAPFDAALIALAPLWQKADFHEVEDFLYKWEKPLRMEGNKDVNIRLYMHELNDLISTLMQR